MKVPQTQRSPEGDSIPSPSPPDCLLPPSGPQVTSSKGLLSSLCHGFLPQSYTLSLSPSSPLFPPYSLCTDKNETNRARDKGEHFPLGQARPRSLPSPPAQVQGMSAHTGSAWFRQTRPGLRPMVPMWFPAPAKQRVTAAPQSQLLATAVPIGHDD